MKTFLKYFLLFLLALIAFFGAWLYKLFGPISFDQLIFHLNIPMLVTEDFLPSFASVSRFLRYCILPTLAILLIYGYAAKKLKPKRPLYARSLYAVLCLGMLALSQNFWRFDTLYGQAMQQVHYGQFYEQNYRSPQAEEIIFPSKKRNLILLVVESMESTFGSSNQPTRNPFGELTPNLSHIADSHFTFKDTLGGGGGKVSGSRKL